MTAKELLEKIPENEQAIKNAEYEMRLLQLQRDEIDRKINEHKRKLDDVALELNATKKAVDKMPTRMYREMLKRHYVDGQTWETVAEAINYSVVQLYNYRPLALKELEETWDRIKK